MNIIGNQPARQMALLAIFFVFGITSTYMASTSIQKQATKSWLVRGEYDAQQMTNVFTGWLEEIYGPVKAMAVLLKNSSTVTIDEYQHAADQLDNYQREYFPDALIYMVQNTDKEWIIEKVTKNDLGLHIGQTLAHIPGAMDSIDSAHKWQGEMILGPSGQFVPDGKYYAFSALSVKTPNGVGIMLGVLDVNEMDMKIKKVLPYGMGFSVASRHASGVETEARDHLYPEGKSSANAVAIFNIPARSGGTDFIFNWGITESYQEGSSATLARVILVSGVVITLIITVFIRFLLTQHSKTQRIVEEQTLLYRSSERLLKEVTNNMPGAVYQTLEYNESDARFTFVSEGVSELFGIDKNDVVIDFNSVFRNMVKEDIPRVGESLSKARKTLMPWFEEYRVQIPNKPEKWIENGAKPSQLEDGSVIWNGYWRDITEQKEMQGKIVESVYRYESALDAANVGLWDIDIENNSSTFNNQYYRMLGYEEDELSGGEGLDGLQLVHPDDIEKLNLEEAMYSVSAPDDYKTECRMMAKSGEYRNVLAIGKIIARNNDGKPTRAVGVQFDITEQKQAEERLRQSEERFQLAMESANIGLWDADMVTGIAHYNEQYFKMLGYDRGEFEDNHENWTELIHPDDRERSRVNADKLTTGKVERSENEFRMIASNGEEKAILSIGTISNRDENDKPTRIIGIHIDITERKSMEEEIRKAKEKAEKAAEIAETTLDNMGQGILMIDGENNILIYNEQFLGYVGITTEEAEQCHTYDELFMAHKIEGRDEALERSKDLVAENAPARYEVTSESGKILDVWHQPLGGGGFVRTYTDISERKQDEERLQFKLELEQIVSAITAQFRQTTDIDAAINASLEEVGKLTSSDRATLWQFHDDGEKRSATHEWCDSGVLPVIKTLQNISTAETRVTEIFTKLEAGQPFYIPDVKQLPADAGDLKSYFERRDINSIAIMPIIENGRLTSFLNLNEPRRLIDFDNSDIALLKVFGESLHGAIQRREAEEALRTSQTRFQTILDNSNARIYLKDLEGRYLVANKELTDALGMEENQIIGKTDFDIFPEEIAKHIVDHDKVVLKSSERQNIEESISEDGVDRIFSSSKVRLLDSKGDPYALCGISTDITERKNAESVLKENVAELELFNKAAVGRELRMIDLKQEINKLLHIQGNEDKYVIIE
jgi:PAS domain S-box-containing protein